MKGFSVTYEITTHESAENGEAEESGFRCENVSLREAIAEFGGVAMHADSWPFSLANPPHSFVNEEYQDPYEGSYTQEWLHLPRGITPSSAMRIARLLGARGAK